jgi:hypothetical protein
MIDDYRFGHIKINGKEYTSDVIIHRERIRTNWWRESGHCLSLNDLKDILKNPPEILIIGTGSAGVMDVPPNVQSEIRALGITLIIERTEEACNKFNELLHDKNVVAALHLTC